MRTLKVLVDLYVTRKRLTCHRLLVVFARQIKVDLVLLNKFAKLAIETLKNVLDFLRNPGRSSESLK